MSSRYGEIEWSMNTIPKWKKIDPDNNPIPKGEYIIVNFDTGTICRDNSPGIAELVMGYTHYIERSELLMLPKE